MKNADHVYGRVTAMGQWKQLLRLVLTYVVYDNFRLQRHERNSGAMIGGLFQYVQQTVFQEKKTMT